MISLDFVEIGKISFSVFWRGRGFAVSTVKLQPHSHSLTSAHAPFPSHVENQ